LNDVALIDSLDTQSKIYPISVPKRQVLIKIMRENKFRNYEKREREFVK